MMRIRDKGNSTVRCCLNRPALNTAIARYAVAGQQTPAAGMTLDIRQGLAGYSTRLICCDEDILTSCLPVQYVRPTWACRAAPEAGVSRFAG